MRGQGLDCKAAGVQARGDLLPRERARRGGAGERPDREGGHDRPAMAVLAEIDVDLALAGPDGAGEGGEVWRSLGPEEGQKPGEGARLLVCVAGAERDQDERPSLEQAVEPEIAAQAPEEQRARGGKFQT